MSSSFEVSENTPEEQPEPAPALIFPIGGAGLIPEDSLPDHYLDPDQNEWLDSYQEVFEKYIIESNTQLPVEIRAKKRWDHHKPLALFKKHVDSRYGREDEVMSVLVPEDLGFRRAFSVIRADNMLFGEHHLYNREFYMTKPDGLIRPFNPHQCRNLGQLATDLLILCQRIPQKPAPTSQA